MTEGATTFLAFRLIEGEWHWVFLDTDCSSSAACPIPAAELIELIRTLEALKDKSAEPLHCR